MTALDASDLVEFFTAVRGHEPFPWQRKLVAEVLDTGLWPEVIDVSTGLGKTSLIDIGVFVAAASGCRRGGPGRRRVFFAIDRRIVVDEASAHAEVLARALGSALEDDSVLGRVARSLDALHGADDNRAPLTVTRMRGGLTWAWRWLDRPDRPAVVVGTVDQLGSRVLFGGYGTGPRLRPIDAALSGVDSLLIVDEAHLAQPFVETLHAAASTSMVGGLPLSAPVVVTMSATPPADGDWRRIFPKVLTDADESPVAAQRIHARKRLHGVLVPKNVDPVGVLAGYARDLFDPDGGVVAIGVVCNTVQRARDVAERLRADPVLAPAVHLLTGRIRPHDRDVLVDAIAPHVRAGRERHRAEPIILVATQTIEVGANLDLDALVTESAPIDAIIQRLGRLFRLGLPEELTRHCVVVHHEPTQPLYGAARDRTWDRLVQALGSPLAATPKARPPLDDGIDASPAAMRALVAASDRSALVVEPATTPTLLPEILAEWAATSSGEPLADRAPFLHGRQDDSDDMALLWRADLPAELDDPDECQILVDRLPPVAGEQLDVPIRHVRRWLLDQASSDLGDVAAAATADGRPGQGADQAEEPTALRTPVLIWRGPGDGEVLRSPSDLRRLHPGDVVVVPAAAGGCDAEGWHPSSRRPVPDLGEVAAIRARRIVRLHPDTLPRFLGHDAPVLRDGLRSVIDDARATDEADVDEVVAAGLRAIADQLDHDGLRALADRPIEVERTSDGKILGLYVVVESNHAGPAATGALTDGSLHDTDPAATSTSGSPVTLDAHHVAVAGRARGIAAALGLEATVAESVAVAAGLHDLGKWDPRFQVMMHGGDVVASRAAVASAAPLAKSRMRADDRAAASQAWVASRLPRGYRHEAGSAQAVEAALGDRRDVDSALVAHLVASHHGNARPLLPAIDDDGEPFAVGGATIDPSRSVDFDHPARFHALSERYGHWGLAMLETIVRLSDIGCSEEGS